MAIDSSLLVSILAIFLIAGIVKGLLGFGLPIITMSLLPFVVPVEQAIVLSAVVQPATNIFQLATAREHRRAFRLALPVLLALVPGIVLGASFLTRLSGNELLMIVGMTIVLFSLNELVGSGIRIPENCRTLVGGGFGFIAGIFGALTAINGWAFIMYLVGIGANRQEFRATIALLFLVSGFLISSSFWIVGLLDVPLLITGLIALVPSFAGMWAGNQVGERLPAETFRRLLLIALVFIGGIIVMRAAGLFG